MIQIPSSGLNSITCIRVYHTAINSSGGLQKTLRNADFTMLSVVFVSTNLLMPNGGSIDLISHYFQSFNYSVLTQSLHFKDSLHTRSCILILFSKIYLQSLLLTLVLVAQLFNFLS